MSPTFRLVLLLALQPFATATATAIAATVISCAPKTLGTEFRLWPQPYLTSAKQLCFNTTGYVGNSCVKNGGQASWSGVALIFQNGESFGRDDTDFRVTDVVLSNEAIQYHIEWGRGGKWRTLQRISINRLDGSGVSWLVGEHGGDSLECKAGPMKF